jgi:hypothetical protein
MAEGLAVEKSEKLFAADILATGKKIFEAISLALKLLACHKLHLSVVAREPRTTHACTVSLVQSQGTGYFALRCIDCVQSARHESRSLHKRQQQRISTSSPAHAS